MDFSQFQNPYLIGIIMAFMTGPVFFGIIKTSIIKGVKAGITFELGATSYDVISIIIAYYGSKPLLEKIQNDPRLTIFGGIVLLGYGLFSVFKAKDNNETSPEITNNNYLKLYLEGFFLNIINIGVLAGWLGLMIIIGPNYQMDATQIALFFGKVILTIIAVDLVKIIVAQKIQSYMTPKIIYSMKLGIGLIILICGIGMLLKTLLF